MAAYRSKWATLLVVGERGEIDRYVRGSVVGASGGPPNNSETATRQICSCAGERRIREC